MNCNNCIVHDFMYDWTDNGAGVCMCMSTYSSGFVEIKVEIIHLFAATQQGKSLILANITDIVLNKIQNVFYRKKIFSLFPLILFNFPLQLAWAHNDVVFWPALKIYNTNEKMIKGIKHWRMNHSRDFCTPLYLHFLLENCIVIVLFIAFFSLIFISNSMLKKWRKIWCFSEVRMSFTVFVSLNFIDAAI